MAICWLQQSERRGACLQAEAKRFLGALARKAELQGKEEFTVSELFDVADLIELGVPDLSDFIDQLNDAGPDSCWLAYLDRLSTQGSLQQAQTSGQYEGAISALLQECQNKISNFKTPRHGA